METDITGTLHEDPCTFMIISRSILPIIRNISDNSCRQNQYTHFGFENFSENRAVYEIMWKNIVESTRLQMTIKHAAYVLHAA